MVRLRRRWLTALVVPTLLGATGIVYADDKVEGKARAAASANVVSGDIIGVRQSGDRAIQSGSFDDAARVYVTAALRSPSDPVLRMLAGVALSAVRKPDLAVQQFKHACQITGDDLIASLLLQGALAQSGQNEAAQTVYLEAVRRYGKNSGGLDSSESLTWLQAALKQTPASPILHLLLGDAYQIAENSRAADVEYHKAIVLAPQWAKPKVNLGLLYLAQDKPAQAVALFESALKGDPNNVELMFFRADAQRQSGDLKGAIASYRRIETSVPAAKAPNVNAQALTGLGQAYAAGGQYQDAVSTLNRAKTIAPGDPAPVAALGEVQAKQRSFGDAAQNYADALRLTKASGLFGTQAVLYQALAQTQMDGKQTRAALETLNRAMTDEPDNAALWQRMRGEALLAIGDQTGAEVAFRASIDAQSNDDIFPQDTLTAIAGKDLMNVVIAGYQADIPGVPVVSGENPPIGNAHERAVVVVRPPSTRGTPAEREIHALQALAAIAQFRQDTRSEIAYREKLIQRRNKGGDLFMLAAAYDSRTTDKARAKAYYMRALNIGGLTQAQSDQARLRIKQLSLTAKP